MKRILVTGGAGFLGSNLCRRLLRMDGGVNQILCLDNFYTGKEFNIADMRKCVRFKIVRGDVRQTIDGEVDQIYNLACPASPPHYQKDPIYTMRTCVEGAINVLELAKRTGAKVLQASTSEVYGDPQEHPQTEQYWGHVNPIGIRSCYDEGKRAAETLFFDYARQYEVNIKVARIFNTYGPYMDRNDGRVVSNFIMQALQDKPITIYGNGSQTRSFCYVGDLITGLVNLMNSPDNIIGPINLGNPTECDIIHLARVIIELTNSKSGVVYKKIPLDDPVRRCPDISLAKGFLRWFPILSLDVGFNRILRNGFI